MKTALHSPPIIALLTDFGHQDEYVGVMKGVILTFCRTATIIDLCHTIPPQDVAAAARMLSSAHSYFPENTIFLAVVDPGVGTGRDILLLREDDRYYLGPDNGIFSAILQSKRLQTCAKLPPLPSDIPISSTFHGRDIMAPVAGKLTAGTPLNELAEEIEVDGCVVLDPPFIQLGAHEIEGEIVTIDHFGNIGTSIKKKHLVWPPAEVEINIAGVTIAGLSASYAEKEENELLGLIDSRGYVEIAKNKSNAAAHLGVVRGDRVLLRSAADNHRK